MQTCGKVHTETSHKHQALVLNSSGGKALLRVEICNEGDTRKVAEEEASCSIFLSNDITIQKKAFVRAVEST